MLVLKEAKKDNWNTLLWVLVPLLIIFLPLMFAWPTVISKLDTVLWNRPINCYHAQGGGPAGWNILKLNCYQNVPAQFASSNTFEDPQLPEPYKFGAGQVTSVLAFLLFIFGPSVVKKLIRIFKK